jgi:hypothetical protein
VSKFILTEDVLAVCFICRRPSTSRWAKGEGDCTHTLVALCDDHRDALPGWRRLVDSWRGDKE